MSSPPFPPRSRSRSRLRNRASLPILTIILSLLSTNSIFDLVIVVVANPPTSSSSGSGGGSTGYNVYNYDLTTPQFTPSGLLKQVEYACAAPINSTPMIILPISIPPPVNDDDGGGNKGTEYALVIATISPPSQNDNDSDPTDDAPKHIGTTGGKKNANNGRRGQSRIIEIPIPSTTTTGGCSSVVVGLNGILSDSVSLLQTARQSVQSHHSRYGAHRGASSAGGSVSVSVASAKRVAESIANRCQEHSFGGGMRPFGVSMVVCGLDGNRGGCFGGGRMIVCITDPSGAVYSYRYGDGVGHPINNNSDDVEEEEEGEEDDERTSSDVDDDESLDLTDVIVIGGEERTKAMVRRQLFERLRGSDSITTSDVNIDPARIKEGVEDRYAHVLRRSVRATVEALAHLPTTDGNQRSNAIGGRSRFQRQMTTAAKTSSNNDDDDNDINYEKVAEQMDLIIVTSRAGVQRIGKAQIIDLMMSMPTTNKSSST